MTALVFPLTGTAVQNLIFSSLLEKDSQLELFYLPDVKQELDVVFVYSILYVYVSITVQATEQEVVSAPHW